MSEEREAVEAAIEERYTLEAHMRRDDGSYIVPITEGEDADAIREAIDEALPEGWSADWTGSSNTDADGTTTSDLHIHLARPERSQEE